MTIVGVFVAIALAFFAFRFVKGVIKFAALSVIVLFGAFVAHRAGAF